jgi:aminotransferase
LSEIAELAKEKDFLVISDEIYNEFIWGPGDFTTISKIPGMRDRTIIIMSFSKTFAMTGWRIGYAISSPALISLMRGIPTGAGPCDFMQKAAAAALNGPFDQVYMMRSEYEKRIDHCVKRLNEIPGVFCPKPQGAFYLFPDVSGLAKSSIDFCEVLARDGKVMLAPGIGFGPGGEGHVRIALVRSIPVLDQCMDAIERIAKSLRVS